MIIDTPPKARSHDCFERNDQPQHQSVRPAHNADVMHIEDVLGHLNAGAAA
jgi:hypothetical protein